MLDITVLQFLDLANKTFLDTRHSIINTFRLVLVSLVQYPCELPRSDCASCSLFDCEKLQVSVKRRMFGVITATEKNSTTDNEQ